MPFSDRFQRRHTYLRIAVTDRCNLRCTYCMPAGGVSWRPRGDLLTLEEIVRVTKLLAQHGVNKVRLTGGEPLVRSNIAWLVRELSRVDGIHTVAMTTNGSLLSHFANELRANGLNRVNISLDSLHRDRYREIAGRDELDNVLEGIETALRTGYERVKINVVVMAGVNDDELLDFVELTRTRPLNVRFIEFMPFPGNTWDENRVVPWMKMLSQISGAYELTHAASTSGNVARDFNVSGHAGTVSFITPMSEDFCANCNRLRLTADGSVKSCLLYPAEVNIRDALRSGESDQVILNHITQSLQQKHFAHPPVHELVQLENRCMSTIGG